MTENDKKRIEKVIGSFQYYGRAVDSTTLHTLRSITELQSTPTETTIKQTNQFLDYMATQPVATTRFTHPI